MTSYVYCHHCNKLINGWDVPVVLAAHCTHHTQEYLDFPGVLVIDDFVSEEEEKNLINEVDKKKWEGSQSGRRKQNYGPKVNFKKKKISIGSFQGFPEYSRFVQDKFKMVPLLQSFQSIEQCFLEYDTFRGAQIDPHIDDCWIWGERILTVNLLSDSVLTLTRHKIVDQKQYNLDEVEKYKDHLIEKLCPPIESIFDYDKVIRIPMPRRSLILLYGPARYMFEHSVLREDIVERRIGLCYREFTKPYLADGDLHAEAVLEIAENFF